MRRSTECGHCFSSLFTFCGCVREIEVANLALLLSLGFNEQQKETLKGFGITTHVTWPLTLKSPPPLKEFLSLISNLYKV